MSGSQINSSGTVGSNECLEGVRTAAFKKIVHLVEHFPISSCRTRIGVEEHNTQELDLRPSFPRTQVTHRE
jgi:hypothetical protein